jgi:carboxymethylenebutenolidase
MATASATPSRTDAVVVGDESFDLHVWVPEAGHGPGILLFQEIFGVGPYIRSVAERLAGLGYVVAAPDVFWRLQRNWEAGHDEAGLQASIGLVSSFDFPQGVAGGLDHAGAVTCPVIFHFGDNDPYLPNEQVDAIRASVGDRPDVEIHVQAGAGHAFDNHEAAMFWNEAAAAAAWERTVAFLRQHLPVS